jgi:alkylated DNA repair dioxygenase AlkB
VFDTLSEVLQGNLFATGPPEVVDAPVVERHQLDDSSWIDVSRSFLGGSDDVLDELLWATPWKSSSRWMFDRAVDDPRLHHWCRGRGSVPHPALTDCRRWLEGQYGVEFGGVALNYYRDGNDSVAAHRDRELKHLDNTIVAIVTLGAQRAFHVRPAGGGSSRDLAPASGDLIVMGGSCQSDWEHGVPKTKRPVGPRVSASWRWSLGGADPEDDGHLPD